MNESTALEIFNRHFPHRHASARRASTGMSCYVYFISSDKGKFVVKISDEKYAFENAAFLSRALFSAGINVPRVLAQGIYCGCAYLILSFLQGKDIGLIYEGLGREEKRKIAETVTEIQKKTEKLVPVGVRNEKWYSSIDRTISTAKERITENGFFDPEKASYLERIRPALDNYFDSVEPVCYLDDLSTKNLLIENGAVSGVVDVDSIGYGDRLTYIALTETALRSAGFDTVYSDYLLELAHLSEREKKAYRFYCLMYCVDFMGERGSTFNGRKTAVSSEIIFSLNRIYDGFMEKWLSE